MAPGKQFGPFGPGRAIEKENKIENIKTKVPTKNGKSRGSIGEEEFCAE